MLWPDRPIGSVMPIALGQAAPADSVWSALTAGRHVAAFETARGALAALLEARGARLVLPAYSCLTLAAAARGAVAYYPVDATLEPDVDALAALLQPGDVVVGVDYFGRAPTPAFRALAAERNDVLWVEDRAQALDTGAPPWGQAQLYSPRKLFGVADGGILVADFDLPQPTEPPADDSIWQAQIARAEDEAGLYPETWFAPSNAREAAFAVTRRAMSPRTRDLLSHIDPRPETAARQRNYAALYAHLSDFALFPDIAEPDFAPLAFPVLTDAAEAAKRLAAQRIFCARHWPALPSPASFAAEHALAARCLSIPCEPRYTEEEMHRAGAAVRAILSDIA